MNEINGEMEKRKEKIKSKFFNWIKKPLNLSFVLVLIFALVIRLYYFILINNQPLWWDELCYGSLAKNFILHTWDKTALILHESMIRPVLFPFLWFILMKIGISELGSRFLLEFIPSIFSILFIFLIGKEIFGKRAGIISAFIFSVLWIHLFYSLRLLTNVPALAFLFLSIYLFIKSTKSNLNFKYFSISLFLLSISTLLRYPNGLFFFVYLLVLIFGKQFLLKKPKFWFSGIIGVFPILLFFLVNLITKKNIFPALFSEGYLKFSLTSMGENITPIAFNLLNYIPIYLKTIFFIFFILGFFLIFFEILIGYNLISKNIRLKNYLLILLSLITFYSFFIFYLRYAEDRWIFPMSFIFCCLAGFGIDYTYKSIKKYNKYIAIFSILVILFAGAYSQIKHADNLIEIKKTSYLQMKQGFEWIKQSTEEDSVLLGQGIQPYAIYYAERKYFTWEEYNETLLKEIDYVVLHGFEHQSQEFIDYINSNPSTFSPVHAVFFDEEKKQPAVVIYLVNNP